MTMTYKLDPNIEAFRKDYESIPIPEDLEARIKLALDQAANTPAPEPVVLQRHKRRISRGFLVSAASLAAAFAIFVAGINLSPAFAEKAESLPLLGKLVKVLTLKTYSHQDGTYNASLEVPGIEGLENEALQESLNAKYLEENQALYDTFMEEMALMEAAGGGHLGVDSGYVVLTDTDELLSVSRYVVNTVGSSSTVIKYDTIDKTKEILITLPSLFKDERYVQIISEEIKRQMLEQYEADPNRFYWAQGIPQGATIPLFERISDNQSFYITGQGELVISFDKYEVAPGYMGVVTFTIPTQILEEVLVSHDYLK